jgi:hypothetical protein
MELVSGSLGEEIPFFDEYNIKDLRIFYQSFDDMEVDLRFSDNERK